MVQNFMESHDKACGQEGIRYVALERLMTVADVTAILNRSQRFVRDHGREMGEIRIGGGARRAGRLRFRPGRVMQFIAAWEKNARS